MPDVVDPALPVPPPPVAATDVPPMVPPPANPPPSVDIPVGAVFFSAAQPVQPAKQVTNVP